MPIFELRLATLASAGPKDYLAWYECESAEILKSYLNYTHGTSAPAFQAVVLLSLDQTEVSGDTPIKITLDHLPDGTHTSLTQTSLTNSSVSGLTVADFILSWNGILTTGELIPP